MFVPSVSYYDVALAERRRVRFLGRDCWVLAPESLAVFKMLFHRPKDLADVGRLLEIQGDAMRPESVRTALVSMLGADDERVAEWDGLVAAARAPN